MCNGQEEGRAGRSQHMNAAVSRSRFLQACGAAGALALASPELVFASGSGLITQTISPSIRAAFLPHHGFQKGLPTDSSEAPHIRELFATLRRDKKLARKKGSYFALQQNGAFIMEGVLVATGPANVRLPDGTLARGHKYRLVQADAHGGISTSTAVWFHANNQYQLATAADQVGSLVPVSSLVSTEQHSAIFHLNNGQVLQLSVRGNTAGSAFLSSFLAGSARFAATLPVYSGPTFRALDSAVRIGASVDAAENWHSADYLSAVKTYFGLIHPSGAFIQFVIDQYGSAACHFSRKLADDGGLRMIVAGGYSHADVPAKVQNAPESDVVAYMEDRARFCLGFARPGDIVYFLSEAMWVYQGNRGWEKSAYYRVFGESLPSAAYLVFDKVAGEMGLTTGKDFRLAYSDYDIFSPGEKSDFVLSELLKAKQQIAKAKGIRVDQVQLDVAIEGHFNVGAPIDGYFPPPTADEFASNLRAFSQVGRLNVTEVDIAGASSQAQITDVISMIEAQAISSELVDNISYWYVLRQKPSSPSDTKWFHPNGMFKDNRPTSVYAELAGDALRAAGR